MRFVDLNGNVLTQIEKEQMDYSEGRFLQDLNDHELYTWSPWATVPPREEEHAPSIEPTQIDTIEAQVLYTALITDTLLPEEE